MKMKMKAVKYFCSFAGLIIIYSFVGVSEEDEKIYWRKNLKLSWNDFRGVPETNKPHASLSDYGINSFDTINNRSVKFTVVSYFHKNKSWIKQGCLSGALLHHEQGHFDIAEVYARKLRKTLKEYHFNLQIIKRDFHRLSDENYAEFGREEALYDIETNHSKNTIQQRVWEQRIANELNQLDEYCMPDVMASLPQNRH